MSTTAQTTRTVDLPDGTVGYRARRSDDCFRAAVATVLQRADVPDPGS